MSKELKLFEVVTRDLPRFADGRVNYTDMRKALVLVVVVYYKGEILIVKRSDKVGSFPGLWNGISGYIDEPKSVEDFARQELSEELSIVDEHIDKLVVADPYDIEDGLLEKDWVVYPVLAILNQKPNITLDWEHTDFAWIPPEILQNYSYITGFDKNVELALAQLPA